MRGSGAPSAGCGRRPDARHPQGADQFLNAEIVVETGVGLRLMPDEVSAGAVRDALRELVDDGRYRDAAAVASDAIDAMPSPDAVVPILEGLARA